MNSQSRTDKSPDKAGSDEATRLNGEVAVVSGRKLFETEGKSQAAASPLEMRRVS